MNENSSNPFKSSVDIKLNQYFTIQFSLNKKLVNYNIAMRREREREKILQYTLQQNFLLKLPLPRDIKSIKVKCNHVAILNCIQLDGMNKKNSVKKPRF